MPPLRPSAMNVEGMHKITQVLEAAFQLSPFVASKVVSASVPRFAEVISASRETSKDTSRLVEKISHVGEILIPMLNTEIDSNSPIWVSVERLSETVIKLAALISERNSQSRLSRFLSGVPYALKIREAESELESALSAVSLHLGLDNSLASRKTALMHEIQVIEIIAKHHEEELALIQAKAVKMREEYERLPTRVLPLPSQIFHGRISEIQYILPLILRNEASQVAILGAPGMGKTSLALAVMHHPEVAKKFGYRRYFISCESAETPDALNDILSRALSLPQKQSLAVLKRKVEKGRFPLMITFDNLETTWEPSVNRDLVEKMLSEIASIPRLCLLVTLRGAERPMSIAWTRPMLPPLSPLDMESSKKVFSEISDTDPEDPNVEALIRAVDMWPLPMTLLANQAQYVSPDLLLGQWNKRKTEMVTRGFSSRLADLEVSIQISLESERFKTDPGAMEALQILSILPDGIDISHLSRLLSSKDNSYTHVGVLIGVGLVSRSTMNRVYCLSPIREYISSHTPLGPDLVFPVLKFYVKRLSQCWKHQYDPSVNPIAEDLVQCQGNVRSVMSVAMEHAKNLIHFLAPTVSAVYIAYDMYREFSSVTSYYPISQLGLSLSRQYQDPFLEGICLLICADNQDTKELFWDLSRQAITLFQTASQLTEDQKVTLYRLLHNLAYNLVTNGQFKDSVECLEKANRIHLPDLSPSERLQILRWRILRNERSETLGEIAACLEEAEIVMNQFGLTNYAQTLYMHKARDAQLRGLPGISLQYSARILNGLTNPGEIGRVLFNMAQSYLLQSNIKDTVEAFSTAHRMFQTIESIGWMSTMYLRMHPVFLLKGEFDAAQRMLKEYVGVWGMNIWAHTSLCRENLESGNSDSLKAAILAAEDAHSKQSNSSKHELWTVVGDMWMRQGLPFAAITPYVTATSLYCRDRRRIPSAMCIQRIGDLFLLAFGDTTTAEACYMTTLGMIRYLGISRHLADCLVRLGLTSIISGHREKGLKYVERAETLFRVSEHEAGVRFCEVEMTNLRQDDSHTIDFRSLPDPTFIGLHR